MLYPDSTLSLLAQSFSHNENTSETGSLMYCISILQLKATCRVHVWKMAYSIYVSLFFSFFLSLSLIKITVITVHFCCTNYLPIWLCFVSTCLKLLLYLLLQICDILTKYTNLLENILKNWNICARFTNNKNVLQSITVAHLNVKCFFWHAFIYFDFVLYLNKCTSIWHQSFQNNVLHKDETWKFTH